MQVATTNQNNQLAIEDKIQMRLQREREEFENECKNTFFLMKYMTVEELQESILNLENERFTAPQELKPLIQSQIRHYQHDKQKVIEFNERQKSLKKRLELKYYHPVEYVSQDITTEINESHIETTNFMFEEFENKVKQLCPDDKDYSKTINSVYSDKSSKSVIQIFENLRTSLIKGFIEVINACTGDVIKLGEKLYSKQLDLYTAIEEKITDHISQYPTQQLMNAELAKSYSQTLLSSIHQFVNGDLSKFITNQVYEILDELGVCAGSHEEQTTSTATAITHEPIVEEPEETSTTTSIIQQSHACRTIQTFMQTLPVNTEISADDMLRQYNQYMHSDINRISFGKLLNQLGDKLQKKQKRVDGAKTLFYTIASH